MSKLESKMSELINDLGRCKFEDVSSTHPMSYPSSVHDVCRRLTYAFQRYTSLRIQLRRLVVAEIRAELVLNAAQAIRTGTDEC